MDQASVTSRGVVADIIAGLTPTLPTGPLKLLHAGEEFDTWSCRDAIVKLPRTTEEADKLVVERAMHDRLTAAIGDLVPAIVATGEPSDAFPFAVNAYRRARGRVGQEHDGPVIRPKPWASKRLAADVAAALRGVHGIGVRAAKSAGVGSRPPSDVKWFDPSEAAVERARKVVGDRVDAFLGEPMPAGGDDPVVCHADLKGEHLFVSDDGTRITGIIDWADMTIAEPAVDLAGLTIWLGPAFVRSVAVEYGASDTTAERAIHLGRMGLLEFIDEADGEHPPPRALIDAQLRAAFGV